MAKLVQAKIRDSLGQRLSRLWRRVVSLLSAARSGNAGRVSPLPPPGPSNSPRYVTGEPRTFSRGGRKQARVTLEGVVHNIKLRRTKDRRWLLMFNVKPDIAALPTVAVALRGDDAKRYANALEERGRVRVSGRARTVMFLNAKDITSVSQPIRCRVAK